MGLRVIFSPSQKAKVLENSRLGIKDLAILLDCGRNKAAHFHKEVATHARKKGKLLSNDRLIPTDIVIDYFSIDEKRLRRLAREPKLRDLEEVEHELYQN